MPLEKGSCEVNQIQRKLSLYGEEKVPGQCWGWQKDTWIVSYTQPGDILPKEDWIEKLWSMCVDRIFLVVFTQAWRRFTKKEHGKVVEDWIVKLWSMCCVDRSFLVVFSMAFWAQSWQRRTPQLMCVLSECYGDTARYEPHFSALLISSPYTIKEVTKPKNTSFGPNQFVS